MKTLEFHPIADVFPMIGEDALATMTASIKATGLAVPIVLFEGKILDGRNRYQACQAAGIKPRTEVFKGTGPQAVAHSWKLNFERRHLNPSQAAIADAKRQLVDDAWRP